jgi:hypothetical protein
MTPFPFGDPIDSVGHQCKMVTSYVEREELLQFIFQGERKSASMLNNIQVLPMTSSSTAPWRRETGKKPGQREWVQGGCTSLTTSG